MPYKVRRNKRIKVSALHDAGIKTIIHRCDNQDVANRVPKTLGIDDAYGDLLPEDKVEMVAVIKKGEKDTV